MPKPRSRHFTLNSSGDRLYAANQCSGTVVSFAVHPGTGRLQRIGAPLNTGTPTFILLNERQF